LLTVNSVEHSSTTTLLAVGGNHTSVLGYSSNKSHHLPKEQLKIMKEISKIIGE